jgi:Cu/Ag efflux protein CusF
VSPIRLSRQFTFLNSSPVTLVTSSSPSKLVKLLAIFVSLALAGAQTAPAPLKNIVGEVTSIDASAKQIKVKADDATEYTVALNDTTNYLHIPPGEKDIKKATKIAFSDVAVGDRLLARGTLADETKSLTARTVVVMTKADLAQKHERDRAEWQKRGIAGTVTAVNADAKEVTINTHGRDAKSVVIEASAAAFRRYASDSIRFNDAKPSTFAELQAGDTVRALGDKNEDGTRFKAEELISGSFQTIAATVVSVNAATGEVIVTDLKTKKQLTVETNQNSQLRRLDERIARFMAMRMNPGAAAAGGGAAPGGPAATGSAAGGPPAARGAPPSPTGAGASGGGFPGAGGAARAGAGGGGDLQQMLERQPQLSLAELKKGDALIISSSKGADGAPVTAFSLVAGVEPFLAAAPRTAGQPDLGSWSLSVGMPEQ